MSKKTPEKKPRKVNVWRPKAPPEEPKVEETIEPASSGTLDVRGLLDDLRASVEKKDKDTFIGLLRDMGRVGFDRISEYADADRALMIAMSGFIEAAASRYAIDPGAQWEPGEPLKLLLAGYSGTRNTGADVRVEEMIRQFRHLFGDEHVALSIFTLDPELTRGYFRTVRQLELPKLFPKFLFDTIHDQHAVIACEGSMFKSKFANALSTMMVGAIGLASAEGKLAIGYGGEAGKMDESLARLVKKYCQDALIIARNENSKKILGELGVASRSGTDTAWTFDPAPPEVGRKILMDQGWDGKMPILALCPINPFWWPVKPHVRRAAINAATGVYKDSHYASVYFHKTGFDVVEAQHRYLGSIATAVAKTLADGERFFPVMFGSEQLDRDACESMDRKLARRLGPFTPTRPDGTKGFPIIVSDQYDMYEMVSAMRQATYMISSRYHACVMTMAGGVVSGGVTMDERIRNLMKDRGTPELALEVDDPDLYEKCCTMLKHMIANADSIREGIDGCVYANLERMGQMGQILVDHVRKQHPEFPFRPELGEHGDPWDHLPPLAPTVQELVERVRSRGPKAVPRLEARA